MKFRKTAWQFAATPKERVYVRYTSIAQVLLPANPVKIIKLESRQCSM